jgi:tRNA(Ile)-lysidine synthase
MPSFLDQLRSSWPPENWGDVGVIVAVSGGADSVALLTALSALRPKDSGKLAVAHFNHQTRGKESDDDESFVRSLAERLDLQFHAGRPAAGPSTWDTRDGFEAAARQARYEFLTGLARTTGARYVAVAHTADDQAETVLHRILRGTGIAGLAGMPRARELAPGVTLIRPLLAFRREEVRAYLLENRQEWREDASNANLDWTRNRIRGELLPRLTRDYNSSVVEALLRLGDLAREAQQVIDRQAETLLEGAVQVAKSEEVTISLAALRGQPEYVLCEFFIALWRRQGWPRQSYGRDEWRRLARLAADSASEEASITLPGAVLARRCEARLLLTRPGN